MERDYHCVGGAPSCAGWVAILNSRQGRYPQRGEEWIRATLTAVRQATSQGKGILTSTGLHPWELSLWATGECGGYAALVLPSYETKETEPLKRIAEDFGLHPDHLTGFLFSSSHSPHRPKESWLDRDRLVTRIADELWPISVRPGGNLERLIEDARLKRKPVKETHRVPYRPSRGSSIKRILQSDLAPWTHQAHWPYLTHWTRSFGDAWPGERKAEYYAALCREGSGNPRSAVETLSRILSEGRLRGSSIRMPGKISAVAFTELVPASALKEMRYRKRFQRWSFEPYAVALDRGKLEQLGARPVVYDNGPPKEKNLFVQGQRSGKADWSGQREWRFPGDLDLSDFQPSEGVVLVRNESDKDALESISRWPILVLTN